MAFLNDQSGARSNGGSANAPNVAPFAAFVSTIERLEQVIDLETKVLNEHKSADLREFNYRKSHGLLELNRAILALGDMASTEEVRQCLTGLRAKLDKNRLVLRTHLQAVQEIAAIITRVIEEDDSDGTYSAFVGGGGIS